MPGNVRLRISKPLGVAVTWQPTHTAGLDFVIIAPVTTFHQEGIYAFTADDTVKLYRCRRTDAPLQFLLASDNPLFTGQMVDADWFRDAVLGKAVAEVRVTDPELLRRIVA